MLYLPEVLHSVLFQGRLALVTVCWLRAVSLGPHYHVATEDGDILPPTSTKQSLVLLVRVASSAGYQMHTRHPCFIEFFALALPIAHCEYLACIHNPHSIIVSIRLALGCL